MRYYELTIVPKKISDSEKIISSLQIQPTKKEIGSGFFTVEFYTEPGEIGEIEKKLKSEPQITKYLILKKEPPGTETKSPHGRIKREKKPPSPKVELQDIDKKLKEIFGE